MGKKCMHARIHGRVQGVFFRDYTRKKAQELGLSGWVRNCADSTVETRFEGAAEDVDRMVAWLHTGSPLSAVTRVESREEEPDNRSASFIIRYDEPRS